MSNQPEQPSNEANKPDSDKPAVKVPLKPPASSLVRQAAEKQAAEVSDDTAAKPVLPPAPGMQDKDQAAATPQEQPTPADSGKTPAEGGKDTTGSAGEKAVKPKIIAPPASASRPQQQQPARPLKVAHAPVLPPRPAAAASSSSGSAAATAPPPAAEGNVLVLAFDFIVAAVAITFATLILIDLFS